MLAALHPNGVICAVGRAPGVFCGLGDKYFVDAQFVASLAIVVHLDLKFEVTYSHTPFGLPPAWPMAPRSVAAAADWGPSGWSP